MDIARECGADGVIETSARANTNVDKVFEDLATKMVDLKIERESYPWYG